MDNSQTSPPEGSTSPAAARRPVRRKKPPARRAAGSAPRPASKKKTPPRRKPPASSWQNVVGAISARASAAGASVAGVSGDGLARARQALEGAGDASRKAIETLADQWKKMDGKKRAGVFAALIAALAAASAPVVSSRIKKK